jgi:hypothetical protein
MYGGLGLQPLSVASELFQSSFPPFPFTAFCTLSQVLHSPHGHVYIWAPPRQERRADHSLMAPSTRSHFPLHPAVAGH